MVSYVDSDAIKMLRRLVANFDQLGVRVLLAGCPPHVGRLLERVGTLANGQTIYISVPDAVEQARQEMKE